MLDIDKLRNEIDDIDKQIIELFEKRMDVVLNVAKYKMERNLPIFNGARENAVIEKNLKRLKNKEYSDYAEKFLNVTILYACGFDSSSSFLKSARNFFSFFESSLASS